MIVRFASIFAVALVLLLVEWLFPDAVLFVDWWDAILLAFVLQVASSLTLWPGRTATS